MRPADTLGTISTGIMYEHSESKQSRLIPVDVVPSHQLVAHLELSEEVNAGLYKICKIRFHISTGGGDGASVS